MRFPLAILMLLLLLSCAERPPVTMVSQQLIAQCGAGLKYTAGFTAGIESRAGGKALTVGVESAIKAAFLDAFSSEEAAKQYGPYTNCITGRASVRQTVVAIGERLEGMRIQLEDQKLPSEVIDKLVAMAHDEQDSYDHNDFLAARTIRANMTQIIVDEIKKMGNDPSGICYACMEVHTGKEDRDLLTGAQEISNGMEEDRRNRRNALCQIVTYRAPLEECAVKQLSPEEKRMKDLIDNAAHNYGVGPEDTNRRIQEFFGNNSEN